MATQESVVSPRLINLKRELDAGNIAALDDFWRELSERGAPLIELMADSEHAIVTILCRAPMDIKSAGVFSPFSNRTLSGQAKNFFEFQVDAMTRLLDTDLWYRTYRFRRDLRTQYRIVVDGIEQPDPLNPRTIVFPGGDEQGFQEQDWVLSVLELPAAPPQPWLMPRPGVGRGQIVHHRLRSDILNNERRISVYTPFGYAPEGDRYPLLVLFDGLAFERTMSTPTVLDNLIGAGAIPPLVTVMISSLDFATRERELLCNPSFAEFMIHELIPMIRGAYHVSADPSRTIVGGFSACGLTGVYLGLQYSDVFGNVLSQSGLFWWKPDADPEDEWLARQFVASPRLPVVFYLEVGLREMGTLNGEWDFLRSNRHLRDVLQARGYKVNYSEYNGGHDWSCWRGSLADGLMALIGKESAGVDK
jgi:enterochelin esterase-like enzyme